MLHLKVAIIGAGPAGLTLALALLKDSINVTIFERDADATSRTQGGTLDLHPTTGIAALKRIDLYDDFLKNARFDGEAMTIADRHLRKWMEISGSTKETSYGRPEIDRTKLRDILLNAIPRDRIKWNAKLLRVDKDLTLHFDKMTETGFDLVVGADGTWSKIRPLLSPVKPAYTGITGIRFRISDCEKRFPDLDAMVNKGLLTTFSDGQSLMAQQVGDGSLTVSAYFVRDEDWATQLQNQHPDPLGFKQKILDLYDDWAPELRKFIEVADDEAPWAVKIYHLPVGHRWPTKGNFTLIGDAAHVFPPFAGEGANIALKDAISLADAIIETNKSPSKHALVQHIRGYEEDMFRRAKLASAMTYDMTSAMFFTEGAPGASIDRYLLAAVSDALPWFVVALLAPLVSLYFWYVRRFGATLRLGSNKAPLPAST